MITSPLIPQEHSRKLPSLSFAILAILLLSAALLHSSYVKSDVISEEIAVGTDFPFFDHFIKGSTWWNGMCKHKCNGKDHQCGLAQDTFEEIFTNSGAENFVAKRFQAMEDGLQQMQKVYVKPTGDANKAPADLDALLAMAASDAQRMFQAIGNKNALINVVVEPDHTFLLEANEGKYRLYQSWIDAFTLRYWLGAGWKKKTQGPCWGRLDNDVQEAISAARDTYGKLQEFDASVAKSMVLAAISQLAIKLNDDKESLDYSDVTPTTPFLGKETTMNDAGILGVYAQASRGTRVSFGYFFMPDAK